MKINICNIEHEVMLDDDKYTKAKKYIRKTLIEREEFLELTKFNKKEIKLDTIGLYNARPRTIAVVNIENWNTMVSTFFHEFCHAVTYDVFSTGVTITENELEEVVVTAATKVFEHVWPVFEKQYLPHFHKEWLAWRNKRSWYKKREV